MTLLASSWYDQQDKTSFHFFNDNNQWLQIDKVGHSYGAYLEASILYDIFKWSGLKSKNAACWAGGVSFLMQSSIEVFDGFSKQYGASLGDVGFNAIGSLLFTTQQIITNKQRLKLKYSFIPSGLANKRPNVLGNSINEQMLKDYNGQVYWLSYSFGQRLSWLAIAAGYGGKNMLYGNPAENQKLYGKRHVRQFFLSPDVHFSNIPTNKKGIKVLFKILDYYKVPLPSIEFNPQNYFKIVIH